MVELLGKSLTRSWADGRRQFLAGTMIFGVGVLLELARYFVHSPLFMRHTRNLVGVLMSLGLLVQIWGLVARYHNSGGQKKTREL